MREVVPSPYPLGNYVGTVCCPVPTPSIAKSFIKIRDSKNCDFELPAGRCQQLTSIEPLKTLKRLPRDDISNSEDSDHHDEREQTKNSTEHDNFQNCSERSSSNSKSGESEDCEKSDYIKTIFEITRIDRKSRKVTKMIRNRHIISHCEHIHEKYYAKGMWKKCYFSKGQTKKKATKWIHKNRAHYATGMCKLCYLKEYHKTHERKRAKKS